MQLGKPLSSLTHEDCLHYERFVADPQPAATRIANAGAGGGRKHARAGARFTARCHPPTSARRW